MRVVLPLLGLALGVGLYLWIDPFGETPLTVEVRVIDAATREPVAGVKVKSRFDEAWATTNGEGVARLSGVTLAPGTAPSTKAIGRILEIAHRYAVPADEVAAVTRKGERSYAATVRVETFGVLTLAVEPTILQNVRAYVEASDGVRAVAIDGRGVARIGETASYRIFTTKRRIPVVIKGDMGVGMQRFMLRTPAPGTTLTRRYGAFAALPIGGSVELTSGEAPPALSGRIRLIPDGWPESQDSETIAVPAPIDPVVIRPDGTFDIPHILPGRWRPVAELDFLGPVAMPEPVDLSVTSTGWTFKIPVRTSWYRVGFPAAPELDPRRVRYTIERAPPAATAARVVHHADDTYVVLPETGAWTLTITTPGSDASPPLRSVTSLDVSARGGDTVDVAFEETAHGKLTIRVPDAVRTAMRGATLTLDTGRSTSLLANLTKEVELPFVPAGKRTVTVTWRERGFDPFVQEVDVPPGGDAVVEVARVRTAP